MNPVDRLRTRIDLGHLTEASDNMICVTNAVLELADQLDTLKAVCNESSPTEPGPFRVTVPGLYRMRNGRIVKIDLFNGSDWVCTANQAQLQSPYYWRNDGKRDHEDTPDDLVEGPLVDVPATKESSTGHQSQPFLVTGPGRYRQSNGQIATIGRPISNGPYVWEGRDGDGCFATWTSAGLFNRLEHKTVFDLVEGPFADNLSVHESAGLDGFVRVYKRATGHRSYGFSDSPALFLADSDATVIDLSTITKDQLVMPKHDKKQTRTVWINIFPNTLGFPHASRSEADRMSTPDRIACIEREIAFTPGEGL